MKAEYGAIAERRVRLGLVLSRIGETAQITVTPEELNRAIAAESQRHPGQEREIFEFFQKNPQAAAQVQAPLFEEKVVDYILEIAEVSEKEVSTEELMADPDEDVPAGEKAVARSKSKKGTKTGESAKSDKSEEKPKKAAPKKAKAAAKNDPEAKAKAPVKKRASPKKAAD